MKIELFLQILILKKLFKNKSSLLTPWITYPIIEDCDLEKQQISNQNIFLYAYGPIRIQNTGIVGIFKM